MGALVVRTGFQGQKTNFRRSGAAIPTQRVFLFQN